MAPPINRYNITSRAISQASTGIYHSPDITKGMYDHIQPYMQYIPRPPSSSINYLTSQPPPCPYTQSFPKKARTPYSPSSPSASSSSSFSSSGSPSPPKTARPQRAFFRNHKDKPPQPECYSRLTHYSPISYIKKDGRLYVHVEDTGEMLYNKRPTASSSSDDESVPSLGFNSQESTSQDSSSEDALEPSLAARERRRVGQHWAGNRKRRLNISTEKTAAMAKRVCETGGDCQRNAKMEKDGEKNTAAQGSAVETEDTSVVPFDEERYDSGCEEGREGAARGLHELLRSNRKIESSFQSVISA